MAETVSRMPSNVSDAAYRGLTKQAEFIIHRSSKTGVDGTVLFEGESTSI